MQVQLMYSEVDDRWLQYEHDHKVFGTTHVPFVRLRPISRGAFNVTDAVKYTLTHKEYRRKFFIRRKPTRPRNYEQYFLNEVNILKKLSHRHVIEFVGSYGDPTFLATVTLPVGDVDLSMFLSQSLYRSTDDEENRTLLRSFFGCLADGVAYLHKVGVIHKDIKPSNILIHDNFVLISGFYLAISDGPNFFGHWQQKSRGTPKYFAPEIGNLDETINASVDIWNLGCVYLEILCALVGTPEEDRKRLHQNDGMGEVGYRENKEKIEKYLSEQMCDELFAPITWTRMMLQHSRKSRPSARQLLGMIHHASPEFCGDCCFPQTSSHQDTTDWVISPEQKARFDALFGLLSNATDSVSRNGASGFLGSRLPVVLHQHILDLADIDDDGQFSRDEFAVMMYLVETHEDLKTPLPARLPQNLIPPNIREQLRVRR